MVKRSVLQTLTLPLTFFAILMFVFVTWRTLGLPTGEELFEIAREYFLAYGLVLVPAGAFLEALMFVGWYFPGGTIVFLGVVFASFSVPRVVATVALATVGLYAGYVLNYFIGKYGWYRLFLRVGLRPSLEEAKRRLEKHGTSAIFASYWQPGLGSLVSTAAGVLRVPLRSFLLRSAAAVIFWDTAWGVLIFFLGEAALSLVNVRFVLIIIAAWAVAALLLGRAKREQESGEPRGDVT